MNKAKAWFLTAAVMTLWGMVLYLLWQYEVGSFWLLTGLFGIYGFVSFAVDLGKWMIFRPAQERRAEKLPGREQKAAGVGMHENVQWEKMQ